jgi:pentatricopeptide repeat protein
MSAFTRIDEAAQKGPIGVAFAVGYNRRNVRCPARSSMSTSKPLPQVHPAEPGNDRLDSWKEIAAYLKRDGRTVRRWEAEGLPVRRKVHKKQASVFAYKAEIDAWWDGRGAPGAATDVADAHPFLEIASPATRASRWLIVRGGALLALVVVAYFATRSHLRGATGSKIKSLAVLPLKNLSGDPTQEYLADGMTEALIGRLSSIHDLRVISRTSAMQFKNTSLSVPEIGRTLQVDAVVEGSVMRDDSRIRVHAQLIRAATDEHFWSETYDRELRDVLALQSDVAQSIAQKVEVTITGEERARLTAARPIAPEVYENYLKGRSILDKSYSRSGLEESIGYFEEANTRDPTFAPAYVGLADAYNRLGTVFIGTPPSEVRPRVVNAARKALELDPELAEARVLLADIYQQQWHWSDAQAEYKRALDLKPNDAAAHVGFAHWLLCQGRTQEALAWTERGRELDPIEVSGTAIGETLFFSHRYDEAIRELRSALAVEGDSASALWYLGFSLIAKGQPEDAIPALEKAVSITNRSSGVIGVLIRAYAQAGRRKDALRLLDELKQRRQKGYVPAGAFANAYLGMEDREQAFAWLEHAYQEQSNILQFLKVHPFFDPLRDDPRFKDLLHRVGLDQAPSPQREGLAVPRP